MASVKYDRIASEVLQTKNPACERGVLLYWATAQLNANANRVADGERAEANIDIMDWLGGVRSVRATEEVIGLGSYGKTLTVITCPSLRDESYGEDDDEDEEDLTARWTPRFHR